MTELQPFEGNREEKTSRNHFQESAKNTSLSSLFDPLTLALSIIILFYLSVFFLFKKHTFDPLSTAYLFCNC